VKHATLKSDVATFLSLTAAFAIVVGALVFSASAQNDSKLPSLHRATDTNTNVSQPVSASVVHVFLTVHDKKNKAVTDLTEEDLTITDDGQAQRIQQFSKACGQPLTLGLLVDTNPGQRSVLGDERTASRSFVDQILRAGLDKGFVIHFDHEVELLQDLTASHAKLEQSIDGLNITQFVRASGGNSGNPADDDDSQTSRRGSRR
jgi:VWFA-related protein